MFLGLRTVIYPAPDLTATKEWFAQLLGIEPYFDEPFYVGFNVGGYELGLDPATAAEVGARSYWGVRDADAALTRLLAAGAEVLRPVTDVGEGIKVATVLLPADGAALGIIENPHFSPAPLPPEIGEGPGR